jgi:uncharacterized protein (TIGR03083 family)
MSSREAYASSRDRIQELTRSLSDEQLDIRVPACPDWNVKELVAHITGVAADTLAANLDEIGGAGWTERQVAGRRNKSLEKIFEEWDGLAGQLEPALDEWHPTAAAALIGDVITHEHDLRGALGVPGERESEGVVISTSFYARNFGKRLKDAGLATLIVRGGGEEWTAGREEPVGEVRAPLFEMLRGLTGRRTLDEVKSFDWTVGPEPYLELFPMYPVTESSLNE